MSAVSRVLQLTEQGDPEAAEQLLPLVYEDLRRLAAAKLAREKPGQTLQATALVHEAYLRMMSDESAQSWSHRGHFFLAAAEAMRRILVDRARRRNAIKRGGDRGRENLEQVDLAIAISQDQLLDLDHAINQLAEESSQEAELVKLRFFAGLTVEEAAKSLGISRGVADRYWSYAKAFLTRALSHYRDPESIQHEQSSS